MSWGTLLLWFLILGGGGAVVGLLESTGHGLLHLFDGKKTRRVLKQQLAAERAETARLREQLERERERPTGGPEVAAIMEQARIAIDHRTQMREALVAVRAADDTYTQLGYDTRAAVDAALDLGRAVPAPTGKKKAK